MKPRLLLSNIRIKVIAFLVLFFLLSVATLIFIIVKDNNSDFTYHQSQWNEYAPEIDRAINEQEKATSSPLAHIYGSVVSHHIPQTIPRLVEYYSRLKATQTVDRFIVIGPDHNNAGTSPITVSNANFYTSYGKVEPIAGLAVKLQDSRVAHIDEKPFDPEHSIGSQMLVISAIFPGTKVTPIVLRSDTTQDQVNVLSESLMSLLDEETVLIASVDFSHYLATDQAFPIDYISGQVVRNLDLESLSLINADSGKSMEVFMKVMKEKRAFDVDSFSILNTNDLMQNSDYTTGYVFGHWGTLEK